MIPNSFTFDHRVQQSLSWTLTDSSGAPIVSATVKATLYAGRDPRFPATTPGTPDPNFQNISMNETVPGSSGIYVGVVTANFDPAPAITFICVIEAVSSQNVLIGHWEIPAIVIGVGSPIDLTTTSLVKGWLSQNGQQQSSSTSDDLNIQSCITAASMYWLRATGREPLDGSVDKSSLVEPILYDEWYDGNGNDRLMLNQWPVRSIQLLEIGGVSVALSSGVNSAGYAIDNSRRSIIVRGYALPPFSGPFAGYQVQRPSFGGTSGGPFARGTQNIHIQYTAGFSMTPPDVVMAANQMVGVNYKRRSWIDQRTQMMANGAGSLQYRDWELPPEVLTVMQRYSRTRL